MANHLPPPLPTTTIHTALSTHPTISINGPHQNSSANRPRTNSVPPSCIGPVGVQAQIHSLLIFTAIVGLLTRLGLNALGEFHGKSVFSLLLVQVFGCGIMGMSFALKRKLDNCHPLWYLALTTGYCGSVTTFSGWMLQVFQAFSDFPTGKRAGFFNFLDGMNQTYVTVGMCLFALMSGMELGNSLERFLPSCTERLPLPSKLRVVFTPFSFLVGLAAWLASIMLFFYGPRSWRGSVTYSMIISPLGTLLRFYLAKLNSCPTSARNNLPLGTFLANMIATALLAVLTILQYTSSPKRHPELCGGLQGLKDGFCGCLSTTSTFFLELWKADVTIRALKYGVLSWWVGQLLCVLLQGVYVWVVGDLGQRCRFPTD